MMDLSGLKVCVLQTDNRPTLDYLLKTQEVNKKWCNILKYDYLFLNLDDFKYGGSMHPATKKIFVMNDTLQNAAYDIFVFLDSDAWIQNGYWLNDIIRNLIGNERKQGCFSRDPYLPNNTFINSGSFILKNNDSTKGMYANIIDDLYDNLKYHFEWPYDQYYISKYVFENKEDFFIFNTLIMNTPLGKVLRHNWQKTQKMFDDLDVLMECLNYEDVDVDKSRFIEEGSHDDREFPNTGDICYEKFADMERELLQANYSGNRDTPKALI